jgi:hypothetical protein
MGESLAIGLARLFSMPQNLRQAASPTPLHFSRFRLRLGKVVCSAGEFTFETSALFMVAFVLAPPKGVHQTRLPQYFNLKLPMLLSVMLLAGEGTQKLQAPAG